MKAVFGVVSLLVALSVVGLLVARQVKATRQAPAIAASQAGIVVPNGGSPAQVEKQVADDVAKALAEGAARRASEAE
jgi:multidrug efflux pump subunit AcrB